MRVVIGISLGDIKKFILENYPQVDPNTLKVRVAKALDDCLTSGLIQRPDTSTKKPAIMPGKEGLRQFSFSNH